MMARIRKAMSDKEQGFTLVELLVVIIIIGILAAIAIPIYLDQQKKAKDSAAESDLGNARIAVANYLVDNPDATSIDLSAAGFTATSGVTVTSPVAIAAAGTFCIHANASGGKQKDFSTDQTGAMFKSATCTAAAGS